MGTSISSPHPPPVPQHVQLQNTLGFWLWFYYVSVSFCCSFIIYCLCRVSDIFLLLLLCLKIYDVFVSCHISVPVIWFHLSMYLNSTKYCSYHHKNYCLCKCLLFILFLFTTGQAKNNTKISGAVQWSLQRKRRFRNLEFGKEFLWPLDTRISHLLA